MTTEIAKTEIVNDNNEVVTSYLTIEEKIQALQLLGEEWFSSIKTEKDIYLQRGRILREIINEELYKIKFNKETGIYEEIENREFEDFLKEDSKIFFKRHKSLSLESARNYQAFYLLCNRMLLHKNFCPPVIMHQITPMTHLILNDLDKAEEVWKGALACKGNKEHPSNDDVKNAKPDGSRKKNKINVGFLAQEVQAIEEALGYKASEESNLVFNDNDGFQYGLKYERLVPMLVNAIKELSAKVKALEEA